MKTAVMYADNEESMAALRAFLCAHDYRTYATRDSRFIEVDIQRDDAMEYNYIMDRCLQSGGKYTLLGIYDAGGITTGACISVHYQVLSGCEDIVRGTQVNALYMKQRTNLISKLHNYFRKKVDLDLYDAAFIERAVTQCMAGAYWKPSDVKALLDYLYSPREWGWFWYHCMGTDAQRISLVNMMIHFARLQEIYEPPVLFLRRWWD